MRKFWKYIVHLVILCFAVASGFMLNRCNPAATWNPTDDKAGYMADLDLNKIRKRGYITAIMDNSSTGLFIYRGRTMGYEYELAKQFAESQGLELRINVTTSLEEAFDKLNAGKGDILAYNLTVTKERKKRIAFTHYHNLVRQVLVQRKPENWRSMKHHEIEQALIRNPVDLIGKHVSVRHHSSYFGRLQNLSNEIGGDIFVKQEDPALETEAIIKKVAEGSIDLTVAEEDIALVNATYYPNLDVQTPVSFPTQIAWGVRKNADSLLRSLNNWILEMRKTSDYYVIYNKYFKSRKASLERTRSEYYSLVGGKISPFDSLIKSAAIELQWDWRLLAAQIYQESRFDPQAESWAGAVGLMQLLPVTAEEYSIYNLLEPEMNIQAGVLHIKWLSEYFADKIEDPDERRKFILAAYNTGHGHVMDAMKLTRKFGGDHQRWEDVSVYLLKKSIPAFFNDPVVEYGYCRGIEPVDYVSSILATYKNYTVLYPEYPLAG